MKKYKLLFKLFYFVAVILWITFLVKHMVKEMWIANGVMWISVFCIKLNSYGERICTTTTES